MRSVLIVAVGLAGACSSCRVEKTTEKTTEKAVPAVAPAAVPDRIVQWVAPPSKAVVADVVKLDEAEWHSGGDFPANLPERNGATHIGMFLAWAITRGLDEGGECPGSAPADRAAVKRRGMTGAQFLLRHCDGKLLADDLGKRAKGFATEYYDKHYFDDYKRTLAKGLSSEYAVKDTWANFDKLAPAIDRRYAAWKARPEPRQPLTTEAAENP